MIGLFLEPPVNAIVLCVDEKSPIQALDRTCVEVVSFEVFMIGFNICYVQELSGQWFSEVGDSIRFSLHDLGYACSVSTCELAANKINIVLDYHSMEYFEGITRFNYIPYQLEQLDEQYGVFDTNCYRILKSAFAVFDYSAENLEFLSKKGIKGIFLPAGYHRSLVRIEKRTYKDIDVLFIGRVNKRRKDVLDEISKNGLKVVVLSSVWGKERDMYISRAKIVLNIHFYPMNIMEIVRIAYLLNNEVFVLSENSAINPLSSVGLFCSDYDSLPNMCSQFIVKDELRESLAKNNAALFCRQFDMVNIVEKAVGALVAAKKNECDLKAVFI